ncbi:MAG: pyridoxamine kinase [Candidatus Cloacimonetes bacterium]|nr:pyridoxamine kinase [Candidatus Cloacimonadota bacterium]
MFENNPRILAIHDLSAFGNTSLMAVIPIMYHYGISVCALPSVILSTSTMYEGARKIETTGQLEGFARHWKDLGMSFSAIYTGFLDSPEQVDSISRIVQEFPTKLVLVDPVLADDGKLYSCYDQDMVPAMRRLVAQADLITPNYTEACLLTGLEYQSDPGKIELEVLCKALVALGAKELIITSLPSQDGSVSRVAYYHGKNGVMSTYTCQYIPCFFPGTGDIFSSILLAEVITGVKVENAIQKAIDFVREAILLTLNQEHKAEEGVLLEKLLCGRIRNL